MSYLWITYRSSASRLFENTSDDFALFYNLHNSSITMHLVLKPYPNLTEKIRRAAFDIFEKLILMHYKTKLREFFCI